MRSVHEFGSNKQMLTGGIGLDEMSQVVDNNISRTDEKGPITFNWKRNRLVYGATYSFASSTSSSSPARFLSPPQTITLKNGSKALLASFPTNNATTRWKTLSVASSFPRPILLNTQKARAEIGGNAWKGKR